MGILCSKNYTALDWDPAPFDIEIYDVNQARAIVAKKTKEKHISDIDYNNIMKEKVNHINNLIKTTCNKLEEGVVIYTHTWEKIIFVDETKIPDHKERKNINMFYYKKLINDIGKLYMDKGYNVSSNSNSIFISWK